MKKIPMQITKEHTGGTLRHHKKKHSETNSNPVKRKGRRMSVMGTLRHEKKEWRELLISKRSVLVVIENRTTEMFVRIEQPKLKHGKWARKPPSNISPRKRVPFGSYAAMLKGTAGSCVYAIGQAAESKDVFTFAWQNPARGAIEFASSCPPNYIITKRAKEEKNAKVTFVITTLEGLAAGDVPKKALPKTPDISVDESDSDPEETLHLGKKVPAPKRATEKETLEESDRKPSVMFDDSFAVSVEDYDFETPLSAVPNSKRITLKIKPLSEMRTESFGNILIAPPSAKKEGTNPFSSLSTAQGNANTPLTLASDIMFDCAAFLDVGDLISATPKCDEALAILKKIPQGNSQAIDLVVQYKVALQALSLMQKTEDIERLAEISRCLASLKLHGRHAAVCKRMAIDAHMNCQNYDIAYFLLSYALKFNPTDATELKRKQQICVSVRPGEEGSFEFDFCRKSFKRITEQPLVCSVCSSGRFSPHKAKSGQACELCSFGTLS
eukprot:TRINITY_DN21774_c0_g1_i1.p1 TRINITY_DN21774_c0_g1~~TRINITY_DN21774_c0_g1_i1.p1  ORF type:complete len:523 (-),score=77.79 TRINITY_DN21774_c0_g1_i1:134-1627(-)